MPDETTTSATAASSSDPHEHEREQHAPRAGWKRVLLKLSGEAFAGRDPLGIDPEVVQHVAEAISEAVRDGVRALGLQ